MDLFDLIYLDKCLRVELKVWRKFFYVKNRNFSWFYVNSRNFTIIDVKFKKSHFFKI